MKPVAYFSAEYSIADDLPIYAGGLGILAGDAFMEAAAEGANMTFVGLVYHRAFTGSDSDSRPMTERLLANGFALAKRDEAIITVEAPRGENRVLLQAWIKQEKKTCLVLLDSDVAGNEPDDRRLTDQLYDPDPEVAFAQEVALGFGGIAILDALGIKPEIYHLNEGHTAAVALALAIRAKAGDNELDLKGALARVRSNLVGTKHTILAAAGLTLAPGIVERLLDPVCKESGLEIQDLLKLAAKPSGEYSDTKLLMTSVARASGVSQIHVAAEAKEHAGSPLVPITNGVFLPRWQALNGFAILEDCSDDELWELRRKRKELLFNYAADQTGVRLNPQRLTVVWARRMTAYKRPEMLVSDLVRLARLTKNQELPIQFVVAGQANPADETGIALMNQVIAASHRAELASCLIYLPHYNPATARLLVQGADVWLNTPIRGMEACGTSGMKASLNGALQLSTSDGWVDEIDVKKIGWELSEDATAQTLYDILEREVAPLFYGDKAAWAAKMRNNIALIEQDFSAERMLKDYFSKLYFPTE
jgi:starch phosphorylase